MINLEENFIYYRDIGIIDSIDSYYIFESELIYDIIPHQNCYIDIFINHINQNHNCVKIFVNNKENVLLMNNYETINLIINANAFIENKKLND